jgi:hypothetical protein
MLVVVVVNMLVVVNIGVCGSLQAVIACTTRMWEC